MIRAALALALLLIAAPAFAQAPRARIGLLELPPTTNPNAENQRKHWQALQGACRMLDVDYYLVPWQSTKGLWLKEGKIFTSSGTEIPVDGWGVGVYVPTRWSTLDSMTLARDFDAGAPVVYKWPDVDMLFYGTAASAGYQDRAACSTGIRSVSQPLTPNRSHGLYLPGFDYGWHGEQNPISQLAVTPRTGGAYTGVWRALVGVGAMGRAPTGTWTGCEDCNAVLRQADPDTVTAWWRSRADASGNPIGSRLIFIESGVSDGAGASIDALVVGLAYLDSLIFARTGKRLINRQVTQSLYIDRWFARGYWDNQAFRDTMHPGPEIVDSTYTKATLDSLNALSSPGFPVPITFAVEMDSLDAYPYQEAWMRRVENFRVSPMTIAGTNGGGSAGSNGTPGRYLDLFGNRRDRSVQGAGGLGVATSPVDSSFESKFYRADSLCEARWPGRVDRLVYAAGGDWSPRSVTRFTATQLDTQHAVLKALGYDGYLGNVMAFDTDPGRGTIGPGGGGTVAVRVRGYASHQTEYRVYQNIPNPNHDSDVSGPWDSGQLLGYMRVVPSRGCEGCDGGDNILVGHNNFQEHLWGLFTGEWYSLHSISNFWEHQFQARTRIVRLPAHTLSSGGAGTNRLSYWHALWNVNFAKAVNNRAGRTVMRFTTGQAIAKEPIR